MLQSARKIEITDTMIKAGARALCSVLGINPDNKTGGTVDDLFGQPDSMGLWHDECLWELRKDEARACLEAALKVSV